MTQITYRSNPADPLVPRAGRPMKSEVVRENFQILESCKTLWAYDTAHILDGTTSPVERITSVGTTATVTYIDHPFIAGDSITITGALEPEYNGTFTVLVLPAPTANTFTYTMAGDPTSPATTDGDIEVRFARCVYTLGGPYINGAILADQTSPVMDTTFGGGGVAGDVGIALLEATTVGGLSWKYGAWVTPPLVPAAPAYTSGRIQVCHVFVQYDMNKISGGTAIDLEGVAGASEVTVSQDEHGLLTGDTVLISDVVYDSGDAVAIYESDAFHVVTVIDANSYSYTIAGTFVDDSAATAQMDNHITDVRPLVGGGAGGGGGGITWATPVDADIIPDGPNTRDLGAVGSEFKDGYFFGKLTVGGGIDPTYLQLTPTTSASVLNGSFFLDSADGDQLKFKDIAGVDHAFTVYSAPADYYADTTTDYPAGLPSGDTDQIDLAAPAAGSPTEEGLIVKIELVDGSGLGAGEVLVEIYNDQPRAEQVYSRVFDLADVPLTDVIPAHFLSDNVAGSGAMYVDITNNTGSTGDFQVEIRTANVLPEAVPPAGSGTGIAGTEAGDGLSWDVGNQRFNVELTTAISGLEFSGATPNGKLQAKITPAGGLKINLLSGGLEIDNSVGVLVSGNSTITGKKRFDYTAGGTFGLIPAATSGPPAAGAYLKGDFYLDSDMVLYQCTAAGTPGTWQFWGWAYSQGIDLGITAGQDNASYTSLVTAGSSVFVALSTGIDASADAGRRGVIRKLNVWGAASGFAVADLDQTFRVVCYPNENRYGREQLWSVQGQVRTTYLLGAMSGGVDATALVNSVATGAPDDLVRMRRLAATVGEEYGRVSTRSTGPASYALDEAVVNSFDINDPLMLVTEFVELPWLNNSATQKDKIFVEFFNDGTQDIIFGYQLDNENIGGGPAL